MTDERVTLLNRGKQLVAQQFVHAGIEVLESALKLPNCDTNNLAELHDEIGKAYGQMGNHQTALTHFQVALSQAKDPSLKAICSMHIAVTYRYLSEYDKAHRLLESVLLEKKHLSTPQIASVYLNLASVQGTLGFYQDGIQSSLASLHYFKEADLDMFDGHLYNNLGLLYVDLKDYENAEKYLLFARECLGETDPSVATELSRLYLLTGNLEQGETFLHEAVNLMWQSVINFSKEDVSRICYLLAQLTFSSGDKEIALRLIEKAQLVVGQLGMWHEWENMDKVHSMMSQTPSGTPSKQAKEALQQAHHFLTLMDVMNAQEYLHEKFSSMLDLRVLYAEILAQEMNLPQEEIEHLIFACRFADYGLTAIDIEAVHNPHRSPQAFEQYKQHPTFSVKMLKALHLPDNVLSIIADHHEYMDGTGFPKGKKGDELPMTVRIISVVDEYVSGIMAQMKSHSEVLASIQEGAGTIFDKSVVQVFVKMFEG